MGFTVEKLYSKNTVAGMSPWCRQSSPTYLANDTSAVVGITKGFAAAYKVSPKAMEIRLTNLGITGPF
jgi:hypothetical protein